MQVGSYVVGVFSVLGLDDALLSAEEFEGPVRPGEAHRVGAHKAKRRRLGAYRPAISTAFPLPAAAALRDIGRSAPARGALVEVGLFPPFAVAFEER